MVIIRARAVPLKHRPHANADDFGLLNSQHVLLESNLERQPAPSITRVHALRAGFDPLHTILHRAECERAPRFSSRSAADGAGGGACHNIEYR